VTGVLGALLVSLFNVKWRFSVQGGGVEGSKFCLFSVALPLKLSFNNSNLFNSLVGFANDVKSTGAVCDQKSSKFFVSSREESITGHMGLNGVF
jgi:hypothetical protein